MFRCAQDDRISYNPVMANIFVDTAKIRVAAGKGGDGKVSFRREKYVPRGGPDGGNGGKGGDVFFIADNNMATLMDFRAKEVFKAGNGAGGDKKNMTGESASDLFVKVPAGTLVYEILNNERILVGDLVTPGQSLLIAKGGRGGRGNASFKSATNQAPLTFTPGAPGEAKTLVLGVKLIADVGLVGFPNAGKSTLINQLTGANVKTAAYPFTTLTPNLGVLKLAGGRAIIVADIPGLIEGASRGKGLGDDFLRHIERTKILVHIVDPLAGDALALYDAIRKELADYSLDLGRKSEIVVINKLDVTEARADFDRIAREFGERGILVLGVSAVTGKGVRELKNELLRRIE